MLRRFVTICCIGCGGSLFAQEAAPVSTLHVGTQLVVVDVGVADGAGNPVHGLPKSAFSLWDNGKQQTVSTFEEHGSRTNTTPLVSLPKLPPGTFSNRLDSEADGPLNVVLIDTLNTPLTTQARVRQQLERFVEHMKPGPRIAVFGLGSRLILLQGFTSNLDALRRVLVQSHVSQPSALLQNRTNGETSTISDMLVNSHATAGVAEIRQWEADTTASREQLRTQLTLSELNQLARYLARFPGRKTLIWFSGSFPISVLADATLLNPSAVVSDASEKLSQTAALLSRGQVAVYPVDASGLATSQVLEPDNFGIPYGGDPRKMNADVAKERQRTEAEQATLSEIATATGGKAFFDDNDLASAAATAMRDGSNFYTLTYVPSTRGVKDELHRIDLKAPKGYKLTFRREYYVPPPSNESHRETSVGGPMTASMQHGTPDITQIVFTATLEAKGALTKTLAPNTQAAEASRPPYRDLVVTYAVDPATLTLKTHGDGVREVGLEFSALVYDSEGKLQTATDNAVRAPLNKGTYAAMTRDGVRYLLEISVPARGNCSVKLGVHDLESGRIGTFEIPTEGVPASK